MKLQVLVPIALLAAVVFAAPTIAQTVPSSLTNREKNAHLVKQGDRSVQVTEADIRTACAADRADTLPIPFTDISPQDWAFKAVMNLYYCIGLPKEISRLSDDRHSP
jgi:hypothetical protein